jgi:hypothetical protein
MLKIFWGPKMHFQNIVDGRYLKKNLFLIFMVIQFAFKFLKPYIF